MRGECLQAGGECLQAECRRAGGECLQAEAYLPEFTSA